METLRIGFLNPFFYPFMGGTEKVLYEIGWRMVKRGHEIHVYAAKHKDKLKEQEEIKGMNVERIDAHIVWNAPPPLIPPFPMFRRFRESTRDFSKHVDALHVNNRFIFSYPQIRHLAGFKPVSLTIHNATPQNIDFLTDVGGFLHDRILLRLSYRYISGITGITKAALDMSVPDYTGLKRIVWNGVDTKIFRGKKHTNGWLEIPRDKLIVLSNGRLVRQKGFEYLIKAMKGVNAQLVIFGRGPLENELKALAKKEGVDVIFVTKTVSDEELVDLINLADVFVLPSLYETFGMAVLEAMACGKAVVASNVHGLPEVIGDAGLTVTPRDVEGLRSAITLLLDDEKLRRSMERRARERAEKYFSWDKITMQYEKFFKDVLSDQR
ncbi:MAG: glycosyltransferase family 4 protein [Candidatus Bilamarchaeaceae archaeon]